YDSCVQVENHGSPHEMSPHNVGSAPGAWLVVQFDQSHSGSQVLAVHHFTSGSIRAEFLPHDNALPKVSSGSAASIHPSARALRQYFPDPDQLLRDSPRPLKMPLLDLAHLQCSPLSSVVGPFFSHLVTSAPSWISSSAHRRPHSFGLLADFQLSHPIGPVAL